MSADPAVLRLLSWLDEISDGDLGSFANRTEDADDSQLVWLRDNWPQLEDVSPPPVKVGSIRPLCKPTYIDSLDVTRFAVSVLLYVDQAAVGAERFVIPGRSPSVLRHDFPHLIRMIRDLRSVLEDGSLVVVPTYMPSELSHEMLTLSEIWPSLNFDPFDDHNLIQRRSTLLAPALANAFRAILDERATPLATDSWTREMGAALDPGMFLDARAGRASTLVDLAAPRFNLPTRELVALRKHAGTLADFRASLSASLTDFAELPNDIDAVMRARAVVAGRLGDDLAEILAEVRKSATLSAGMGALRRIGFVGLGAAAGAAMATALSAPLLGSVVGAASGSSIALAESIRETLGARQRRAAGHAVGSVISAFEE
jgi:hypothetical protein